MNTTILRPIAALALSLSLVADRGWTQDWPQWRGPNRDAKVADFDVPEKWPAELMKEWQVNVGVGVATPALVGDSLYVFSRQDDSEIIRCLNAATGEEIWRNDYETEDTEGGAAAYPGPRSSPTVADGKVLTLGVRSVLSCLDAATGDVLWRKDDVGGWPMFFTATSPLVVDGLCITQLGGEREGAVVAYDLDTGDEKWKWDGDFPSYGSPVPMTVDGMEVIVLPTGRYLVALDPSDGRLLMQLKYSEGRYNAGTPIVEDQMLIVAGLGSGVTAVRLSREGDRLISEELWSNTDTSLRFNTPALTGGLIFGLSSVDVLFCLKAENGETAWTAPVAAEPDAAEPQRDADNGRRGGGRGRGRGPRPGFGSVVNAGSVVVVLHPSGQLIVVEPTAEAFTPVARYKVADEGANAYPVLSGSRIYIKDRESVALWTVE
jgi:outer membrane protein assembly factor BamB